MNKNKSKALFQKQRENGFTMDFRNDKLPKYDPLYDRNLRHFFENSTVQNHLYSTGLIDTAGRVINLEKNMSKLCIIEQEFKAAEKAEYWRKKEEDEMRYRVQKKRFEILENARRKERLNKIKEDRDIRKQILEASGTSSKPLKKKKKKILKQSLSSGADESSFFCDK